MEDERKVRVAACGRRWGKTEAAAVDVATMAVASAGSRQMIVSPTYDQSRLVFEKVEGLLAQHGPIRRAMKSVKTPYPRLTVGGSVVSARTADDDGKNLRGHSADRVIVDEAAYVGEAVVQSVIKPMLADVDGSLVLVSTPRGKNHFYEAYVRERGYRFPSSANPHISAAYVERQREGMSRRQFGQEYEAEFSESQASVFDAESVDRAVSVGNPFSESWLRVAGVDWARYTDFTVVVVAGVEGYDMEVVRIERFQGMSWARQVDRVVEVLKQGRVTACACDQTAVGDPLIEELREALWAAGVSCVTDGIVFNAQNKADMVERLARRFDHGRIGIPADEVLLRELSIYEYEHMASGNVRFGAAAGGHDDVVTALALASLEADRHGADAGVMSGRPREWPPELG
jgi:phage FluMu gp28-like protein